jgi:ADP-ribose pyrophosphatase YjhB (NUDIX family)
MRTFLRGGDATEAQGDGAYKSCQTGRASPRATGYAAGMSTGRFGTRRIERNGKDVPHVQPAEVVAELQGLLARHRGADTGEQLSIKRTHQLLKTTGSPFWRGQFNPGHLTASAIVVNKERTKTLLVHHAKLDRWLQPGGHFEPGEWQPVEAATREVREETGLGTTWPGPLPRLLDVDVHAIPARNADPGHYHYDLRYLLVAQDGEATAGDGTRAVKWVGPDELEGLGLDPALKRALKKVWRTSGVGASDAAASDQRPLA